MPTVLTLTHIADSRRTPLDKDDLLKDVDHRVRKVQRTLEKLGMCTVTVSPPEFFDWEHEKCIQWRMQMTIAKRPKVGCWDTIVAAILAVSPVKCRFVKI